MKQKRILFNQILLSVIDEYGKSIHFRCKTFCTGAESYINADDLYQQVIWNLWKSICSHNGEITVTRRWVDTITTNTCLNYRKAYLLRLKMFRPLQDFDIPQETDDGSEERSRLLYTLIEHLKPMDKAIIQLVLDGRSYREVGEILHLSESNVGTRMQKIKERLKELKDKLYGRDYII